MMVESGNCRLNFAKARASSPAREARALPAWEAKQNAQQISRHAGRSILATSYSRTAYRRTTIGAAAFHFRVRNGNGWCHCATVTRAEKRLRCSALVSDSRFVTSLNRGYFRFTIHVLTVHVFYLSKNCRFAGIYIQVFGNKSAENSGRYNI